MLVVSIRENGKILAILGMNSFVARLLSFIDTNSAFLLGTDLLDLRGFRLMSRYQPFRLTRLDEVTSEAERQMTNPGILNLERFLGLMGQETEM